MGAVCCKLGGIEGNNSSKSYQKSRKSSDASKPRKSSFQEFESVDRKAWISEQCKHAGDQDLFTKEINECDFQKAHCIGRGAYSSVYLVYKKDTGRPYAMKVIKKSINKIEKDRVKLEKKIMTDCYSPFLVKLYCTFQTQDKLFFILEYVNGGELNTKLIKAGVIKEGLARFYAAEILLALKIMHEKNYLHRDVNPRNILIDNKGHIKIIDFGLSKNIKEDSDRIETCGTPAYCAPEIIKGGKHENTMDFWSFGVLLYEMLHGKYPFLKGTVKSKDEIFKQVLNNKLKIDRNLSPFTEDFLKKLLNKDPAKRLGANGIEEILNHPFLETINFKDLSIKKMKSPYVPKVKSEDCTKYISGTWLEEPVDTTDNELTFTLDEKREAYVRDFSFYAEGSFAGLWTGDSSRATTPTKSGSDISEY
ncbi:unnamed protein product [Moneuplotes crassus]|uniref:Protein kinase domain-containing protein n=1 Tax=Euplotes crassus TaxID=5936 RepID=A0AAD1ULB3_EUPCR|nr:unnamed protein product [Moneuplotes crassus]